MKKGRQDRIAETLTLVKRKAMSKAVSVFSFHQPYPFVESLMRM